MGRMGQADGADQILLAKKVKLLFNREDLCFSVEMLLIGHL